MAELFERVCGARGAWLDLSDRGLVRVTGTDRVRFLNGMLTCDVAALREGATAAGLQLDRRGHILAQLEVVALPSEILLDVAPGGEPALLTVLGKHIVADDVTLESLSGRWGQLALEGPDAPAAAARLGAPPLEPGACAVGGEILWRAAGALTPEGRRAAGPRAALAALRERLELPRMEAAAAETLRIEAALARAGVDTGERTFPQEARLEGAVSFSKGCYIGQEIVARIQSRGAVNHLLVKLSTDAEVAPGAEIQVGGRVSGRVTSAVVSAASGPLALGYLRRDDAAPGTPVRIGGVAGVVLELPRQS
jgi:folate-binding protein YgfZ